MKLLLKQLIWKYKLRQLDIREDKKTLRILNKRFFYSVKKYKKIDYSKLFNGNITILNNN